MAGDKSVALFLLLLAFLFLLTAPFVLIFGYYSGLLRLPHFITYHNVSVAATAGLFIIPVLFIFLAIVIVALKKGMRTGAPFAVAAKVAVAKKAPAPARYPWEDVFGPEKEPVPAKLGPAQKKQPAANSRALAAVVIALAVICLIILASVNPGANNLFFGRDHNVTKSANITAMPHEPAKPLIKEEKPQSLPQMGKAFAAAKSFASKIKRWAVNSASSLKSGISKVNHAVWRNMVVAAVVIIFAASIFYSGKTGQLGQVPEWFRGWLDWLLGIFAAARKNKLKALLWIIIIAGACAGVAAFVFRKWLSAHGFNPKLPSASMLPSSPLDALLAVRDFVSVYRLYIIIGIFAFLAIIGILFAFEKRGNGKK